MARSWAPIAFSKPISCERSITDAVMRFEMPRADPTRASTVMSNMSSCVLSRMAPSDSATWRLALATESVMTSCSW